MMGILKRMWGKVFGEKKTQTLVTDDKAIEACLEWAVRNEFMFENAVAQFAAGETVFVDSKGLWSEDEREMITGMMNIMPTIIPFLSRELILVDEMEWQSDGSVNLKIFVSKVKKYYGNHCGVMTITGQRSPNILMWIQMVAEGKTTIKGY